MTQITVDTSQFKKDMPEVTVGFGGVPMQARCPDPYALAALDEVDAEAATLAEARDQIRKFLAQIVGTENAARVEMMMADPENEDVTLHTVKALIMWLIDGDGGPKWRDFLSGAAADMSAGNRAQRRVAAKKTAAAKPVGTMKKVPAKAAAKKTAARRAK
jgi:hypothetical protein